MGDYGISSAGTAIIAVIKTILHILTSTPFAIVLGLCLGFVGGFAFGKFWAQYE